VAGVFAGKIRLEHFPTASTDSKRSENARASVGRALDKRTSGDKPQICGNGVQPFVPGPQASSRPQTNGGKQMNINIPDVAPRLQNLNITVAE
jgi:hypothetical protein